MALNCFFIYEIVRSFMFMSDILVVIGTLAFVAAMLGLAWALERV